MDFRHLADEIIDFESLFHVADELIFIELKLHQKRIYFNFEVVIMNERFVKIQYQYLPGLAGLY
jgi:hypothetical protein